MQRRCWRCSTTSMATYPRSRRSWPTRRARGVDRWLLGGDSRCSAAGRSRPSHLPARAASRDLDPRQHATAGWPTVDPATAQPMRGAVAGLPRERSGDARRRRLAALPESASLAGRAARRRGTPRRSPTCARSCPSRPTTRPSCSPACTTRAWSSATPTCRSGASAAATAIELVNPGTVGMPFDGDRRAAYALVGDDGAVEHRRVAYDWEAAREAVLAAADGAPWGDVIARQAGRGPALGARSGVASRPRAPRRRRPGPGAWAARRRTPPRARRAP